MKRHRVWLLAVVIGAVNAVLLRVFELAANDGTDALWNGLFRSDAYRWVVVPLAVGLSLLLTLVVRVLREKRVVPPETDMLAHAGEGPASLAAIGKTLGVGLASLLAGAALGPEAPLTASAATLGAWAAGKTNIDPLKQLLMLASVGALLVAFLGSMAMALVPLLLLYKQKQLRVMPIGVVLAAGLSAFGVLQLIDHAHPGYGAAPTIPSAAPRDIVVALAVGFVAAGLAIALQRLITSFAGWARRIDIHMPWPVSAALFGLVLGGLYLVGGESIEFSGSAGSKMLLAGEAQYGIAALAGLVLAKLLATAWSKAAGYRGGLVFPSIYVGIAFGLLVGHINTGWSGSGALVGGIDGMMSAVAGSPVVAGIILAAILPVKLYLVVLAAIAGSASGSAVLKRVAARWHRAA